MANAFVHPPGDQHVRVAHLDGWRPAATPHSIIMMASGTGMPFKLRRRPALRSCALRTTLTITSNAIQIHPKKVFGHGLPSR